ncbi:MAG: YtxH domain-containing protein [Candidatus Curtissbacteria bacterium]|nr:YtxH domain-containing protein [Candidatus Curtissbacteria bacterium]
MNDHNHNPNHNSNNISSLVAGVVLGAALTYLFGTKSGQKLKDELVKEGQKLLEEMGKELEETKDKIAEGPERSRREESEVGKKLESVKEKAEGTKLVQNAIEAKEQLQEVIEDVPKHIEEIQKKGRRFFFKRSAAHES